MHILIITPYIPFPLSEGGKVSQYALIDYLRKEHQITLLVSCYNEEDHFNSETLKARWPDVVIEQVYFYTEDHVKTDRIYNSVSEIKKGVKKIAGLLKKKSPAVSESASELENPFFINIARAKSRKLIEKIVGLVSSRKFDLVQIEFIELIDLVFAIPDNCKKIFVHHEIRFARLESAAKTDVHSSDSYNNYALAFVKKQERSFLELYDAIMVFSEEDKIKLANEMPGSKIYVAPFPVLDEYFCEIDQAHTEINKLVFVGGEGHAPNNDAVEWYVNEIAGVLNAAHALPLHVIGNWSSNTKDRYAGNLYLVFSGYVDDIISYCKNSIMIVPVRIGSGIRTKILYAMAQGVPVVSTTLGCEGIQVEDGESVLLADTPEEFAQAVHKIMNDKSFTLNMIATARRVMQLKYSQQAAGELRSKYYKELVNS